MSDKKTENDLLWMEVPYEESKRAEAILALLPHHAIDQENLKKRIRFGIYVAGKFPEETYAALAGMLNAFSWSVETVPVKDWVAETQAGLPPVQAGRFIMHGSHDDAVKVVPKGAVGLVIDANTAFGTGHHASTRGCLLMYTRLLKRYKPRLILDLGTGSGVLAIAAAKAQRIRVDATDCDPEAVRVARINADINSVSHLVRVWVSDGYDRVRGSYDLIFANILAKPLAGLAGSAHSHMKPGAHIIMSGLQDWQKNLVVNSCRFHGLILLDQIVLGRWMTVLMGKPARQDNLARG